MKLMKSTTSFRMSQKSIRNVMKMLRDAGASEEDIAECFEPMESKLGGVRLIRIGMKNVDKV